MLKVAGFTNILIAFAHIIGLLWPSLMFELTGIGKEMEDLAAIHYSLPYLITVFVAIIFLIFGLYGLSAAKKIKELPRLKTGIFIIAAIYIIRGISGLSFDLTIRPANSTAMVIYSLIALIIGLLFLFGGLRTWRTKMKP